MSISRRFSSTLVMAVLILGAASWLQAAAVPAEAGSTGVGLMLGSPTGVTGKYWLDGKTAIDADIGWGWHGGTTLIADYLWHDYSAFSFIKDPEADGKLGFYLGGGARVQTDGDDNFGLRGVFGLSYLFPKNPFELYAEIAPVLVLADDLGGDVDGGVGFRYYFR